MIFRNLELVRSIINDASGLDITYAYDDLVFAEHGVFIIQFDQNNEKKLYCYFQNECTPDYKEKTEKNLINAAKKFQCEMVNKGGFDLTSNEETEELNIQFTN